MKSGAIKSAFGIYKKYYLRSIILEVFAKNEMLDNAGFKQELLSAVRNNAKMRESIITSDVDVEMEYLTKIGYFNFNGSGTKITLSETGIKAAQESVWESLASTAFFGYKSLYFAILALCITGLALLVSLASFVVVLCK